MTDEELKELVASLAISQKETDRLMKERQEKTDNQIEKMSRKIEHLSELMGNHTNNEGAAVEDFFYRSLERNNLVMGGIPFDTIHRNLSGHKGAIQDEFDIVLTNGTYAALVETKLKGHENDIRKLVNKKIPNFRALFSHMAHLKIYAALATLTVFDDLVTLAKSEGVFLLVQDGKHIELVNQNVIAR